MKLRFLGTDLSQDGLSWTGSAAEVGRNPKMTSEKD